MDALRAKIRALRCQNTERRHFIPQEALYSVLTPENVRIVLEDESIEKQQLEELAQNITQGKRAIFGILVCIRKVRSILKFVEIDRFQHESLHLDHKLPFSMEDLGRMFSYSVAVEFHEQQWEFIAPIFSRNTFPRYLEDDIILPILQEDMVGWGGFGVIHKILLHDAQQHFSYTPEWTV